MSENFNPLSLISAPVSGLFNMFGAKKQSDAAENVAQQQSAAAKYSADAQQKSAADALAFQKQQAAQSLANAQAAQQGNYNQWAARQGRLSTLGQMVGLKPFQIPAYVPIQSVPDPSAAQQSGAPQGYVNPNITSMGNALNYQGQNS
jgi:hypothetical protein